METLLIEEHYYRLFSTSNYKILIYLIGSFIVISIEEYFTRLEAQEYFIYFFVDVVGLLSKSDGGGNISISGGSTL